MPHRFLVLTLILALVIFGCSSDGADTDAEPPPQTTVTTTTAPTTTTAAASPQELVLTFDGEQCTYVGPSVGDLAEPISLTLVNDSELFTYGVVVWVPPELLEAVMPTVGTGLPLTEEEGEDFDLTDTFYVEVPSGSTRTLTDLSMPAPGTYLLDCATADGATMLDTWRPAAIEFS